MNFVFITEDVNDIFKNYYKCKYNKKRQLHQSSCLYTETLNYFRTKFQKVISPPADEPFV